VCGGGGFVPFSFSFILFDLYRRSLALSVAGGIAHAMFYGRAVSPIGGAFAHATDICGLRCFGGLWGVLFLFAAGLVEGR
jgi:hypothetical protein